jgi:hypothetical protein
MQKTQLPGTTLPLQGMNKKKIGFFIAFFVVLFASFYFALVHWVPGFGSPELPVLSYVPSFSFDNQ